MLRQPLEDGIVTLSRAAMSLTYPARFMLAAAMNPCPCGYLGDPSPRCHCAPIARRSDTSRVSGPLLDRIDIHLEVPAVPIAIWRGGRRGVERRDPDPGGGGAAAPARPLPGDPGLYANAHMTAREIRRYCRLSDAVELLLRNAVARLGLSARAYHRVLKIGRTIADLAGAGEMEVPHVSEAIQYRTLDRTHRKAAPMVGQH